VQSVDRNLESGDRLTVLLAHDLLQISGDADVVCVGEQRRPFWVTDSLERAPFVVVRRSGSVDGLIPIGVRGSMRNQRFGAYLAGNGISSRIGDDLQ
jgi:phosphoribosyl-dephospho-CoA transferase